MRLRLLDRILTVVVTATLTSAAWIVFGGSLIEFADSRGQVAKTNPALAVANPLPSSPSAAEQGAPAPSAPAGDVPPMAEQRLAQLIIPVLNVRARDLINTFADPREVDGRPHEAIDIMAPEGTTVVAAGPGTVEKLFVSQAGGNTIYIRSPDRQIVEYYAHLQGYAPGLTEGQQVRRGQRLGSVGSTGNASPDEPHLHFAILRTSPDAEWWEPASAINPYPVLIRR